MIESQMITIKDVLMDASNLHWSDSLFLPEDEEWKLETKGIVWDPDDVESDEDEVPKIAEENGLFCSIGIQAIKQVVDNVRQQLGSCSVEQLFEAFLYHYDNDAFIEFF